MICVKGSINNSFSTDYHVAVSFNVVNMFPNIDNKTALESVKAVFLMTILTLIPLNVLFML